MRKLEKHNENFKKNFHRYSILRNLIFNTEEKNIP